MVRSLLRNAGGIVYVVFLIVIFLVTKIISEFGLQPALWLNSTVFYIFYFVLSFWAMYSIFRASAVEENSLVIILLPLLYLFLVDRPLLLIPAIALIPVFFFKKYKSSYRMISAALFAIFILITVLIVGFCLAIGNIGEDTVLDEVVSPNGKHKLVLIERDEGALGGSISVKVVYDTSEGKRIKGKIIFEGEWGARPHIEWLDDDNAMIDGKKVNVLLSGQQE